MRYLLAVIWLGCHGGSTLHPVAGSDKDDGHGELAGASAKLLTSGDGSADPFAARRRRRGDDELGGSEYGSYVTPTWTPPPAVHRTYPRYAQVAGLSGAIEGTIKWRGAVPARRATPCGPLDLVRLADDRGVPDVIIYIDQVKTGRPWPTDGRTATVGGAIVKRGCALLPTAQFVTPLPSGLTVAGDTTTATLRVIAPAPAVAHTYELQEGGRIGFTVALGVTRVEAQDGGVSSAWILGIDAPYYAITDDHGRFRIDELAPGTYDVTIWRAPLPDGGMGPLVYGEPLVEHHSVTVVGTKPARLDLSIGR